MKSLLAKLETEIFVLDLQNMPQHRSLVIEHYPHKLLDENTLEVEVQRAQGLTNLFTQLTAQNVEVLSMRNKSNRLEELFLKMAN